MSTPTTKLLLVFFTILISFNSYLISQTIKDYQLLLKGNVSDLIFMGRMTWEIEIPVFKNTSITANLGLQFKEYFYDEHDGDTFTNSGMFRLTPEPFPSKHAFGWNAGLGLRQYFRISPKQFFKSYLEFKGYYRKSNFNDNFQISYDEGSGGGGVQSSWVTGKQRLFLWYLAIGRNNWVKTKKINVDISVGITKNYVELNTCQEACIFPNWLAQLVENQKEFKHSPWTASIVGDYGPKEDFFRIRVELKITFLKLKK